MRRAHARAGRSIRSAADDERVSLAIPVRKPGRTKRCTRTAATRFGFNAFGYSSAGFAATARFRRRSVILVVGSNEDAARHSHVSPSRRPFECRGTQSDGALAKQESLLFRGARPSCRRNRDRGVVSTVMPEHNQGDLVYEGTVVQRISPSRFICHSRRPSVYDLRTVAEESHAEFHSAREAAEFYLKWELNLPGRLDSWPVE